MIHFLNCLCTSLTCCTVTDEAGSTAQTENMYAFLVLSPRSETVKKKVPSAGAAESVIPCIARTCPAPSGPP